MPANKYYYTGGAAGEKCVSEKDRFELTNLMAKNLNEQLLPNVAFIVDDFEIVTGQKTKQYVPTFISLKHLEKIYKVKPSNIYLVIREFHLELLLNKIWKQSIAILERYNFIILPTNISVIYKPGFEEQLLDQFERMGHEIEVDESPEGIALRNRISFIESESRRITGKAVRRSIYEGTQDLATITIPTISEYIKSRKLYKSKICLGDLSKTRKRKDNAKS